MERELIQIPMRRRTADGVANGGNTEELTAELADRIRSSKETIARTETTKASNVRHAEMWRQSGVVTGKPAVGWPRWTVATRET